MKKIKSFSFLTSYVLRPTSVAFFVSRILDPMWVVPAVTILAAYKHGLIVSLALTVLMLGIPLVLRLRYRRGDWDIKNRSHRPKAIAVLLVLGVLNVTIAWIVGNAALGRLFIFYELWLLGFFLISLAWKISGHAGGIALATGLVIAWYGWAWWPLFFLIPLVGWARVATKNHTVGQVTIGALYSWALVVIYSLSLTS